MLDQWYCIQVYAQLPLRLDHAADRRYPLLGEKVVWTVSMVYWVSPGDGTPYIRSHSSTCLLLRSTCSAVGTIGFLQLSHTIRQILYHGRKATSLFVDALARRLLNEKKIYTIISNLCCGTFDL